MYMYIYIHTYIHSDCRYASILSAVGLFLADVVSDVQEPCACPLSEEELPVLKGKIDTLLNRYVYVWMYVCVYAWNLHRGRAACANRQNRHFVEHVRTCMCKCVKCAGKNLLFVQETGMHMCMRQFTYRICRTIRALHKKQACTCVCDKSYVEFAGRFYAI